MCESVSIVLQVVVVPTHNLISVDMLPKGGRKKFLRPLPKHAHAMSSTGFDRDVVEEDETPCHVVEDANKIDEECLQEHLDPQQLVRIKLHLRFRRELRKHIDNGLLKYTQSSRHTMVGKFSYASRFFVGGGNEFDPKFLKPSRVVDVASSKLLQQVVGVVSGHDCSRTRAAVSSTANTSR